MCMKNVLQVGGIPSCLGIKIYSTPAKSACLKYDKHGLHQVIEVNGELIGIPAVLGITPVGINASQQAGVRGYLQFVLEGMAGKSGVIHFYVQFEILIQPVMTKKSNHRGSGVIILVLG